MFQFGTTRGLLLLVSFGLAAALLATTEPDRAPAPTPPPPDEIQPLDQSPRKISVYPVDAWQTFDQLLDRIDTWSRESKGLAESFQYGTSTKGLPLCGIRTGTPWQPEILFHAAIHGNERLSTGVTMWICQRMLAEYGREAEATWLLQNRCIYWIPALNPDTYLESRHVDGVDPNRNYPDPSRPDRQPVTSIKAICDLMRQHKFKGVLSGHTYGRIYLKPSFGPAQDRAALQALGERMGQFSGYRTGSVGGGYNGYDTDFYYWNGACSFVVEMGTSHGSDPPSRTIPDDGERNYRAYQLFAREAPDIAATFAPRVMREIKGQDLAPQFILRDE